MDFSTLLLTTAPALLVAVSAYMLIKKMLEAELARKNAELALASRKITIPMRLQAYERLVLMLERITPESLVLRVRKSDMTNQDLQLALLSAIRSEFEHNLSQQLYISTTAWDAVRKAKESIVTMVNETALSVRPEEPSIVMAKALLERNTQSNLEDLTIAVELLKNEAKKVF